MTEENGNPRAPASQNMRLHVWLPDDQGTLSNFVLIDPFQSSILVGKIIGKKGVVIQHLQNSSGATVSILPSVHRTVTYAPEVQALLDAAGVDCVSKLWTQALISGPLTSVFLAFHSIRDIVGGSPYNFLILYRYVCFRR